jgi:uncharacterized protein (DUF1501 family)
MASKNLLVINMNGGMDGLNLMSNRDADSVSAIQTARQSAPANILNYAEAPSQMVSLVKGSNTFTITGPHAAVVGDLCYGQALPRIRKLTITSIVLDTATDISTFTLSQPSYVTAASVLVYFATATELFKMNENPPAALNGTPTNPALHYNCRWLADAFNVPDIPANAGITKAAIVSLIGPLIRKTYKLTATGGIFSLVVDDGLGGRRNPQNGDIPKQLTSHNDQTSTWLANAPEGAIRGWGGGIADGFLNQLPNPLQRGLAAVSLDTGTPFTAGIQTSTYNASANSILLKYPGFTSVAWPNDKGTAAVKDALTAIISQAAILQPAGYQNDFYTSVRKFNDSASVFQPLLKNAPAITSPATTGPVTLMKNLQQIARLMLMNNPNRGFSLSRSGNIVTAVTAVSNATATRVAGSTSVTITCSVHGMFTSNTSTTDLTDSVVITGIDTATPAAGYKITLVPGDVNSKFTVTSTATTALTDAPVTVRLKHNFTVDNKVFAAGETEALDASIPTDGWQVASVPNEYTITFNTTATGAYVAGTVSAKLKLLNLSKQVFYTHTPAVSWDTHNEANTIPLNSLDQALTYFHDIVDRIKDADVVGLSITEFGRTVTTNITGGTDHGWGNHAYVFGKSVKGNRIYGDTLDYSVSGPHVGTNMLVPTTSVYQYGATFARWMGLSDAEIVGLFPKIVNWPIGERYLGFL